LNVPSGPDKSLLWLGKYLSLALTLPASLVAGYILGAIADHWVHWPLLRAVGILVGMATGIIKIVQELGRDDRKKRAGKDH
jgi:F0F1-type ATP synthase assembly protein I